MKTLITFSALALGLLAGTALTQERDTAGAKDQSEGQVVVTPLFRTKTIIGMRVNNSRGDNVGKIHELIVDADKGAVRYAVVAIGGFLGLGERLYPVPWKALVINHVEKETFFLLDLDREKLKNAPSFTSDKWPETLTPKFTQEVDEFYGVSSKDSPETKTGERSNQSKDRSKDRSQDKGRNRNK